MEKNLKINILNLATELSTELSDYFTQRGIKLSGPEAKMEGSAWTHILTQDMHDFTELKRNYDSLNRDIKLISLSKVNDLQNFIQANGKIIVDPVWMKGPLGSFIMDKFFQEYAGISMGDNYPKFQETGFFNVTNPFSTGDYLDRMIYKAFEADFAALSVKTYFDHLIMFLTGLRNKGKVGLPIEVTYGTFDDIFGVQLHFFANGLALEDITSSLSTSITKRAEESLLNISIQSTDFFDFTFLSQVKKVVITGLWTKDERVRLENRGMMFTSLSSGATITNLTYEGTSSALMDSMVIQDISSKVVTPEPEPQVVSGSQISETLAEKISSSMDLKQIEEILNGNIELETDKTIVSSDEEMEELVNIVKGGSDETEQVFKVSGGQLDVDDFAMRISAGLAEKAKTNMNFKSLGENFPAAVKSGLFDYARGLGKGLQDLNERELHSFRNTEVPKILKNATIVGTQISQQLRNEIKSKLQQEIKKEFAVESTDALLSIIKTPEDGQKVRQLLKSTLKNSLQNNFELDSKGITEIEKDHLVKSLSESFSEDEQKIRAMVTDEKPLFASETQNFEKQLEHQLKISQAENEGLKSKMKTLAMELNILKDSRSAIATMHTKIKQAAQASLAKPRENDPDESLRKHFQERLAQDEVLNQQEQKKLSMLMEREAKLVQEARLQEVELKRVQVETSQKESYFIGELEKANRQLRTKDLMLSKTKEAMIKLNDKKDKEIASLKLQLETMSSVQSGTPSQSQTAQIRELERQNQSLSKMAEMYKAKVAGMVNNLQSNKEGDGASKEELRKLQMLNNQFKNHVDAGKKEIQKLQDKIAYDAGQLTSLRAEKVKLDLLVKKFSLETKKESTAASQSGPALDNDLKRAQIQIQQLENQNKDITIKLKETETRLAEALRTGPKQSPGEDSSKKVSLLEASMKKLTADLIVAKNQAAETKKETNKLRQEKTALQNQVDKLKKDSAKANPKAAPLKKPDSGGKAA